MTVQKSVTAQEYYRKYDIGSDSLYTPLNSLLSYSYDTLQLPENFDQDNFNERLDEVLRNLTHPKQAIDEEGGFRRFVNRQVLPIDPDFFSESKAAIPNYFLHLLGGGMVYRRDLEYFRSIDSQYAQLWSISLAMTGELLQEVFEKKTSKADDAVADFYIFRPLGMLLFSNDKVSGFVRKHLDPVIWPSLMYFDSEKETFSNNGINYVARMSVFPSDNKRLFVFFGLNTLIGISHTLGSGDHLSWGAGLAMTDLNVREDTIDFEARESLGVFYDRQGSLLWSVIFNGTEDLKIRANVYPWNAKWKVKFGVAFGMTDEDEPYLGFNFKLPFGIGGKM